ncbi:MAG TPA: enoyl-CoA hydratase/isomerase family protein [Mycobacteriales bacterium]|nr:enoyl-CoA hydratase/isomerase family protein [Mycobacteriales bacterium]
MTDDTWLDNVRLADVGLRVEVTGPTATVTLARPERRNAQTPAMWLALAGVGRDLPGDVRVVVLRGDGPAFSAGLDLAMFTPEGLPGAVGFAELARLPDDAADALIASYQAAFTWWSRPDIVSVAAVQGHAVGAGFQLALACDLRVLADDAQLTMAETSRGIVPDLGGTKPLVDLVGYPRALEICATGRRVAADEALRLGLAELVVPRTDLDEAVADLVAALLAPLRDAVVETKALLRGAGRRSMGEQLAAERQAQLRRLRDLAGIGE